MPRWIIVQESTARNRWGIDFQNNVYMGYFWYNIALSFSLYEHEYLLIRVLKYYCDSFILLMTLLPGDFVLEYYSVLICMK